MMETIYLRILERSVDQIREGGRWNGPVKVGPIHATFSMGTEYENTIVIELRDKTFSLERLGTKKYTWLDPVPSDEEVMEVFMLLA